MGATNEIDPETGKHVVDSKAAVETHIAIGKAIMEKHEQ
jgi:hypothetical protein